MVEFLRFSKMNDAELKECLNAYGIGLTTDEARQVVQMIGRDPTMVEAVIFGIQGSEHSSYKSSRSFLKLLPTKGPNVILGPSEDSGVVELCKLPDGDKYGVIISHESHNSPSQVVPYEGAATGVGGIIRDIVCMGGKAIATLDPLRFGPIANHKSRVIATGCVEGIAGYGNPIGVPNLGGDVFFDKTFEKNCLVNVVAFGLLRESHLIHSYAPAEAAKEKYDFIIVGKGTDNSGFGGSAFSSKVVDESAKEANKAAVQEPNPFLERHIMASTYDLFKILQDTGNIGKVGFKDMGAGGILCATVELISEQGFGANIDVEKIHVAMEGLKPEVIACSETQERFAWVCHPSLTQMILDHYNKKWDLPGIASHAGASHVGHVTEGGKYVLWHKGEKVCDAQAQDITKGLLYDRKYTDPKKVFEEPVIDAEKIDIKAEFKKLLASENIASRQPVYENYDSTVQGNTVIEAGEADAGVIAPLNDEEVSDDLKKIGVAITADGSGRYGQISPYWQAANAVVESMRNVAAVGAVPQCLTDCLNYGNPEDEHQMWELVEGIKGIKAACEGVKLKGFDNPTPIISGNVSLYKPVSPSAIIACLGTIQDSSKAITSKLKEEGSLLVLLGMRKNEMGGSEFYRLLNVSGRDALQCVSTTGTVDAEGKILGANVPQADFTEAQKEIYALTDLISEGKILSAHDITEGGLAVTLAEMTMPHQKHRKADLSVYVNIDEICGDLEDYQVLFSETPGFVLEVAEEHIDAVMARFDQDEIEAPIIGQVIAEDEFVIEKGEDTLIEMSLKEVQKIWCESLREKLSQ